MTTRVTLVSAVTLSLKGLGTADVAAGGKEDEDAGATVSMGAVDSVSVTSHGISVYLSAVQCVADRPTRLPKEPPCAEPDIIKEAVVARAFNCIVGLRVQLAQDTDTPAIFL